MRGHRVAPASRTSRACMTPAEMDATKEELPTRTAASFLQKARGSAVRQCTKADTHSGGVVLPAVKHRNIFRQKTGTERKNEAAGACM